MQRKTFQSLFKKTTHGVLVGFFAFSFFIFHAQSAFAAPPAGGYFPGTELDPDCVYTDTDCKVNNIQVERGTGAPVSTPTGSQAIVYVNEANGDAYTWDGAAWNILAGGGGGGWSLTGDAGTTPGTNFIGTTDAQAFVIKTNNTEAMRVLSNGRVGVGTTTPSAKFSVVGTLNTVYTQVSTLISGINSGQTNVGGLAVPGTFITHTDGTEYSFTGAGDFTGIGGNTVAGYIGFTSPTASATGMFNSDGTSITYDDSSGLSSAMTLENLRSTISFDDSTDNAAAVFNAAGVHLRTNSAERFTIDAAGDVGIGTTSPDYKFEVQDGGSIYLALDTTNRIYSIGSDTAPLGTGTAADSFFVGSNAGSSATSATFSNFMGNNAGLTATSAHRSNFFGLNAGSGATSANNANFLGSSAGNGATGANNSNFIGASSGLTATAAHHSNFLGLNAGSGATSASNSNFLGFNAGLGATGAEYSNFMGADAGSGATLASFSNFFGQNAGLNVTGANHLNFFGLNAGRNATSANDSNFFGESAGDGASSAFNANFLGLSAGDGATGANNANFFGFEAGLDATGANDSNFFGQSAGSGATTAENANFFGFQAGLGATAAEYSNFIGFQAGESATAADNSNFFGNDAGNNADNADYSNFIGFLAGRDATNATRSNFFGYGAGDGATNADRSVFIGTFAGTGAINADNSVFIGNEAGDLSPDAANSIFIGHSAGLNDTVDNTVSGTSILIGDNTSTGGFSDSIALGEGAENTDANQLMIGSVSTPINDLVITGTGFTTCSVNTGTGAGVSCSSDERLKKNITDLATNSLDALVQLKTVTFKWINGADTEKHIGFIAQNMREFYPELVSTAANGYLQVNYAGITPVIVEAIRELNTKLEMLADGDSEFIDEDGNQTFVGRFFDRVTVWLADSANQISEIIANTIRAKDQLCINDTCVTESQLQQLLNDSNSSSSSGGGGSSNQNSNTGDSGTGTTDTGDGTGDVSDGSDQQGSDSGDGSDAQSGDTGSGDGSDGGDSSSGDTGSGDGGTAV